MVGVDDIDSYRAENDIRPEDPAPREPQGEPHRSTERFDIWAFDAEASETIPDIYIVAKDPEPLDFRMWVFAGNGPRSHFIMRASHKYGEDETPPDGDDDCCEVLMDGQSLRPDHCPAEVEAVVEQLTDTEVVMPKTRDSGQNGPINY